MKTLLAIIKKIAKAIGLVIFGIVPDCDGAVRMGYKERSKQSEN